MKKLFTDKRDFERFRRHLDIIRVKGKDGAAPHPGFPETLSMATVGSRCPTALAERSLGTHWDDGMKRTGANEWSLDIPVDYVGKLHNDRETIDGEEHVFDLSVLYNDYPEEWKDVNGDPEVEPAPKEDTQISAVELSSK